MNLPDLCRYYLRCLSVAYQDGVVVAQNPNSGYVELPTHPAFDSGRANLLDIPGVSALVNLTQTAQQNFLKRTGNVFNVAVTRARAGLIVVGDKQAARNSGVDHLASFVGYVERLSVPRTPETYPTVAKPNLVSGWEEYFYLALQEKGILSTPQYNVDKYILDFALFDNDRRLNIEIDGEHYHRDWNGDLLQRDQLRNMRLRELGWDVMRFWVYEVRDEMELCIRRVQQWLDSEESR